MKVVRILATLTLTGAAITGTAVAAAATPRTTDATPAAKVAGVAGNPLTASAAGRTASGAARVRRAAFAGQQAGVAVPRRGERAVVVLPGAGQMPAAVWVPTARQGSPAARTGGGHFMKASAWTPESGLSGGSLASLTAGALTAAAASLLVATRRHRSRRQ